MIDKKLFMVLLMLYLLSNTNIYSQTEFSGFFDLKYSHSLQHNDNRNLELGQFEVALQKPISKNLTVESAVAFNSETNNFELGSIIADITIYSRNEYNSGKSFLPDKLGIIVGQFDVPFGIDYKCIASPDRKMVSMPIAVSNSIACMNSLGLQFLASNDYTNLNIFLIDGIREQIAGGSRLGITPIEFGEIGFSYLTDLAKNASNLLGVDLKYEDEHNELKGEMIWSKGIQYGEYDSLSTATNTGFYLQYSHQFEKFLSMPLMGGIRYGKWRNYNDHAITTDYQISFLLGYLVKENIEIRSEYTLHKLNSTKSDNNINAQIVFGF